MIKFQAILGCTKRLVSRFEIAECLVTDSRLSCYILPRHCQRRESMIEPLAVRIVLTFTACKKANSPDVKSQRT